MKNHFDSPARNEGGGTGLRYYKYSYISCLQGIKLAKYPLEQVI